MPELYILDHCIFLESDLIDAVVVSVTVNTSVSFRLKLGSGNCQGVKESRISDSKSIACIKETALQISCTKRNWKLAQIEDNNSLAKIEWNSRETIGNDQPWSVEF